MDKKQLRAMKKRIAALPAEKQQLLWRILEGGEVICLTDCLGLTNHRASFQQFVRELRFSLK